MADSVTATAEKTPRPRWPRTLARIVVGVDGSDLSIEALREAATLAEALDARLDAICVWSRPFSTHGAVPPGWHPDRNAARALHDVATAVFGDQKPQRLHTRIVEGSAARELISESIEADLLVVGARGHGGLPSPILGSVSSEVAVHARCSVLIVHPTSAHADPHDAALAGSTAG